MTSPSRKGRVRISEVGGGSRDGLKKRVCNVDPTSGVRRINKMQHA